MKRCKITVLKRTFFEDLASEYIPIPGVTPCERMKEGEVYYTAGPIGTEMPEGFCPAAWNAIEKYAAIFASGGLVNGHEGPKVTCCNDGIRPVIYRMEAVDTDE